MARRLSQRNQRLHHLPDPGVAVTAVRREVGLPVYWLVVGLAVMVGSPVLAIFASVKINERAIERTQATQAAAQAQARVEGLLVYCRMIGTSVDVYSEATTQAGKRAYTTWLTEYRRSGCTPRK